MRIVNAIGVLVGAYIGHGLSHGFGWPADRLVYAAVILALYLVLLAAGERFDAWRATGQQEG